MALAELTPLYPRATRLGVLASVRFALLVAATVICSTGFTQTRPETASGLAFSPNPLNFAFIQDVNVALPVKSYTATLTNNGTTAATISNIAITTPFSQTNNCGGSLAAGARCIFTISATLTVAGKTTGTLTVTDSAGNSPQVLSLSATGANPPRFAFSTAQGAVAEYAVDPSSGLLRFVTEQYTLASLNSQSNECGGSSNVEAISPSNRYLYLPLVCNSNFPPCGGTATCGAIAGFVIDANGKLAPINGSPFPIGTNISQMLIAPNSKFAYVADYNLAERTYYLDVASRSTSTGALTSTGTSAATGPEVLKLLTDPAGKFLYVEDQCDGIYAYTINQTTGTLTQLDDSPYPPPSNCRAEGMAISANGKYLFAVNGAVSGYASGVTIYLIDPATGALMAVSGSPFLDRYHDQMEDLAIDPNNKFVYVGGSSSITVFEIGAGGVLSEVAGSPFPTLGRDGLDHLLLDPTGRLLYTVTGNGVGDNVYQVLSVNRSTGAIAPIQTIGNATVTPLDFFSTGAEPIQTTPTYAYVADSKSNEFSEFAINPSTGALTSLGAPLSFGDSPEALAAFPAGTQLYSAEVGASILSLNIGGTGTLSEKNGVPAPADARKAITMGNTGGYQYVYSVDPVAKAAYSWLLASDGSLIYPADETMIGSDVVSIAQGFADQGYVFALSASDRKLWRLGYGNLYLYGASNYPLGTAPSAIAFDGASRFFYVANSGDNTLSGFAQYGDNITQLNSGQPFPTGTKPVAIVGDPFGKYLYVANQTSQNIWAYSIDPVYGLLSQIGAPVATGTTPTSLAVDISGSFIYCTNSGSNNISIYTINSNGALTPTGTANTGSAPTSIVTVGKIQ